MTNAAKLAEYLRGQARWRADKADEYDDDRNSRAGISLLDAAAYVENLPDSDPRLVRMERARFFVDVAWPGEYGGEVVRRWNLHGDMGGGSALLDALAEAADRDLVELRDELKDSF